MVTIEGERASGPAASSTCRTVAASRTGAGERSHVTIDDMRLRGDVLVLLSALIGAVVLLLI